MGAISVSILIACAVLLLQAAIIAWLLYERWQRRRSEKRSAPAERGGPINAQGERAPSA
jgi:hypothetical protein